jgi:magnesium transporter
MGITLCILGSILVVLHGPSSTATTTIPDFYHFVLAPGFLAYSALALCLFLYLVFYGAPKYGDTNPLVYISMTSICGAWLVNAAQGKFRCPLGEFCEYLMGNYVRYLH